MTWRTPPALKWLITKRSRLSGALLKLDDERAKLRDGNRRLQSGYPRARTLAGKGRFSGETAPIHIGEAAPFHVELVHSPNSSAPRLHELRVDGCWIGVSK